VEIITSRDHLLEWRSNVKEQKRGLTFVPTMGALHQGHLSLIHQAEAHNHRILASIFINPLQFNNPQDLALYPQTPEQDLALLEKTACDAVYIPTYEDVYAEAVPESFYFGDLERVLEGSFRPGHFQGVAKVLYRFFKDVNPQTVVLGLKDFQQFTIVKELSRQFFPEIDIEGAPTLRDEQGLAMSSRNQRLSQAEYKQAVQVANAFSLASQARFGQSFEHWKHNVLELCSKLPDISVEYLELGNPINLSPVLDWNSNQKSIVLIAFYAGQTRLIDNVILPTI